MAYLAPGVIGLYAISKQSFFLQRLLSGDKGIPDVSAAVVIIVFSVSMGIIINAITWATLRLIIEKLGTRRPELDYAKLNKDILDVYKHINEGNYRFYQAYSNTCTSVIIFIVSYIYKGADIRYEIVFVAVAVCFVLFMAARNSLQRTYRYTYDLLQKQVEEKEK